MDININLIKRMGFGKNADLNKKERGNHFSDSKRTIVYKSISRKRHAREKATKRTEAIENLNHNTELCNYYNPIFSEN